MRGCLFLFLTLSVGCGANESADEIEHGAPNPYKTRNVFIVVIDGPRYTETWGDPKKEHIPRLANDLAPHGVVYTNFRCDGPTSTNPGHAALVTGHYQYINNNGAQLPMYPTITQLFLKHTNLPATSAWVITSKDKLHVLVDSAAAEWTGRYVAASNCGRTGTFPSGYREDAATFQELQRIVKAHHPRLVVLNFKEPDSSGHARNWPGYLQGIRDTDEYVYRLWQLLQADPFYKDQTTLFVTNDHGRHQDGHLDGFVSHGDDCEGCRHINLFAIGPDFKKGVVENTRREQVDVPVTAAKLLGFSIPGAAGDVMNELFAKSPRR